MRSKALAPSSLGGRGRAGGRGLKAPTPPLQFSGTPGPTEGAEAGVGAGAG